MKTDRFPPLHALGRPAPFRNHGSAEVITCRLAVLGRHLGCSAYLSGAFSTQQVAAWQSAARPCLLGGSARAARWRRNLHRTGQVARHCHLLRGGDTRAPFDLPAPHPPSPKLTREERGGRRDGWRRDVAHLGGGTWTWPIRRDVTHQEERGPSPALRSRSETLQLGGWGSSTGCRQANRHR